MNRQQFNSNNKVGQTFTFQKSGSTASFTPSITIGGSKRVSYNFGDGTHTLHCGYFSFSFRGNEEMIPQSPTPKQVRRITKFCSPRYSSGINDGSSIENPSLPTSPTL